MPILQGIERLVPDFAVGRGRVLDCGGFADGEGDYLRWDCGGWGCERGAADWVVLRCDFTVCLCWDVHFAGCVGWSAAGGLVVLVYGWRG